MATTRNIQQFVDAIADGEYYLPEFQRGFVWSAEKVKNFFQSLFYKYPTGNFLVWEGKSPLKVRGGNLSGDHRKKLILDGQQRLTCLYTFLKGHKPPWFEGGDLRTDLYFNLHFQEDQDVPEFQYYSKNVMEGRPEWINVADFLQKGLGPFMKEVDAQALLPFWDKLTALDDIHRYLYYIQETQKYPAYSPPKKLKKYPADLPPIPLKLLNENQK